MVLWFAHKILVLLFLCRKHTIDGNQVFIFFGLYSLTFLRLTLMQKCFLSLCYGHIYFCPHIGSYCSWVVHSYPPSVTAAIVLRGKTRRRSGGIQKVNLSEIVFTWHSYFDEDYSTGTVLFKCIYSMIVFCLFDDVSVEPTGI